jgi:hypothetical protein
MDPDTDPVIFVNDLQDVNKKLKKQNIFCLILCEGHHFSEIKSQKEVTKQKEEGIKVFLTIFA